MAATALVGALTFGTAGPSMASPRSAPVSAQVTTFPSITAIVCPILFSLQASFNNTFVTPIIVSVEQAFGCIGPSTGGA